MNPIQASTADPSVHELQERIVHLEKSLLQAHIELACTKSNEDSLKVEVARMSSIIASHDENNNNSSQQASDTDDDEDYNWCTRVGPSYSVPIAAPRHTAQSTQHDENEAPRRYVKATVDTVDPFSRKQKLSSIKKSSSKSSRRSLLNPGSCGSALNLFAFAEGDCGTSSLSSRQGSMTSLHGCLLRRNNNSTTADSRNNLSTSRSRNLLNPNSCASALNLLEGSGSDSLRNMSMASLLRDQSSLLRVQGSGLDIISGLMGTSRQTSGNSLSRQAIVGARANSRSRLNNRAGGLGGGNGGGNQNEEWGVFK